MDNKELMLLFHEVVNKLNLVSVKAGLYVHTLDEETYQSMSKEDLLQEFKKILDDLGLIEKAALEGGGILNHLKETVRLSLDIKET